MLLKGTELDDAHKSTRIDRIRHGLEHLHDLKNPPNAGIRHKKSCKVRPHGHASSDLGRDRSPLPPGDCTRMKCQIVDSHTHLPTIHAEAAKVGDPLRRHCVGDICRRLVLRGLVCRPMGCLWWQHWLRNDPTLLSSRDPWSSLCSILCISATSVVVTTVCLLTHAPIFYNKDEARIHPAPVVLLL